MSIGLTSFWAKTDKDGGSRWHPLALHLLDVAASADAILTREPESTRKRMGEILGLEWEDARAWILLLIACHDVGKACPSFQAKWPDRPTVAGLRFPRRVDKHVNHGFVGQLALTELLRGIGWPDGLAELGADAVGCHHGSRASEGDRDKAAGEMQVGRGERLEEVRSDWHQARAGLFDALREVFRPARVPLKQKLTGPDFMLLAGLTSFADWIGSNEAWFPFGSPMDCENLPSWFESRRSGADRALDAIGWAPRAPLTLAPRSFKEVRINAVIDRYGALIARARRTALPQFSAAQLDLLRSVMRSWATTRAVGDVLIGGLAAALEDASLPGGRGDPDAVAGVLAHVRGLSASEQLALIEEIERGP